MKGPLSGVRVLDVSHAIAGPYGSMILADLGAEVIKVESPEGDHARLTGRSEANYKGQSYFFMSFNRNKKSVTIDLRTPSGREAAHDLVKVSDVVWNNFRPGVMKRLGLDHDTVKEINPRIISCSISGFGSDGPYQERKSFDLVALAMSGVMKITGRPGDPPFRPGPPYGDLCGGMFGAHGVLAALYQREHTGVGQRVDISLLDGQVSNMAYQLSYYLCSGKLPQPMGSGHLSLSPYGAFKTKNGHVVIGSSWPRIARVLGVDWMIEDPRFRELADRVKNREKLVELFEEVLVTEDTESWLEVFYVEDIPSAPVYTVDQVIEDPQVRHNNMIVTMPHPLGGEIRLAGNPIKMPDSIVEDFQAPPLLGQHNEEVLVGILGYSEEKIRRLREEEESNRGELLAHLNKSR